MNLDVHRGPWLFQGKATRVGSASEIRAPVLRDPNG